MSKLRSIIISIFQIKAQINHRPSRNTKIPRGGATIQNWNQSLIVNHCPVLTQCDIVDRAIQLNNDSQWITSAIRLGNVNFCRLKKVQWQWFHKVQNNSSISNWCHWRIWEICYVNSYLIVNNLLLSFQYFNMLNFNRLSLLRTKRPTLKFKHVSSILVAIFWRTLKKRLS